MGLRMKSLNIFGVHLKIQILEGIHKKNNVEGEIVGNGGLDILKI